MKVALIGLGTMGLGMAQNLLRAGIDLAVYNRTPDRAAKLGESGATLAASPRAVASGADVVISMVADDRASRSIWLGDDGAIAGASPGTVFVECSTLSVDWVIELAGIANARGVRFLDAPVTGSRPQAESGQLLFLVGGDAQDLDRVKPALDAMGRGVLHLGPVGSGARMKLINNFVCGVQAAALAEAIGVIEHSSLDRETALKVLADGAPGSPLLKALSERMVARDYDVRFAAELMAKDLDYASAQAAAQGLELRTANAARALFGDAVSRGLGRSDMSVIVEVLRS